eukprot:g5257.t1
MEMAEVSSAPSATDTETKSRQGKEGVEGTKVEEAAASSSGPRDTGDTVMADTNEFVAIESGFTNRASVVLFHEKKLEEGVFKTGQISPYKTPSEGNLLLIFDNRHARWHAKTITCKVTVSKCDNNTSGCGIFPVDGGDIDSTLLWNDLSSRDAKPSFAKVKDDDERFSVCIPAGKKYTFVLPFLTGHVIDCVECAIEQYDIFVSMVYQTNWNKMKQAEDSKRKRSVEGFEAEKIKMRKMFDRKRRAYDKVKESEQKWKEKAKSIKQKFAESRKEYDAQLKALTDRVKEVGYELDRARKTTADAVRRIGSVGIDEETRHEFEKKIARLEARVSDFDNEVFHLQSIRDKLVRENHELREEQHMSTANAEIADATQLRLRSKLALLEKELENAKEGLVRRNREFKELMQHNVANIERINTLRGKCESLQMEKVKLVSRTVSDVDWEAEKRKYEENISTLESNTCVLEDANRELHEQIDATDVTASVMGATQRRLAAHVALLKEKLKMTEEKLEMKSAHVVALEAELSVPQSKRAGTGGNDKNLVSQLLEENTRLQGELKSLRALSMATEETLGGSGENLVSQLLEANARLESELKSKMFDAIDNDVIDELKRRLDEDGNYLEDEVVVDEHGGAIERIRDLDEEEVVIIDGIGSVDGSAANTSECGYTGDSADSNEDETTNEEDVLDEHTDIRVGASATKVSDQAMPMVVDRMMRDECRKMDERNRLMDVREQLKDKLRELTRTFPMHKDARRERVESLLRVQSRLDEVAQKLEGLAL